MRTPRRLLMLAVVLALPLAMMASASAAPNCDKNPNHHTCTGEEPDPPDVGGLNCPDLGRANDYGDETLSISRTDGETTGNDCEDIPAVGNGTIFTFSFAVDSGPGVEEDPENTGWALGIRNGVPGDWCGGDWTYRDARGVIVEKGFGSAASFAANDGYTLELVVNEPRVGDLNCTTYHQGEDQVMHADGDTSSWVITLDRAGRGKKYTGDYSIEVTWKTTSPGETT